MIYGRHSVFGAPALPYDKRVEYLTGSASKNAYVKTSIVPTSTMKIEAELSLDRRASAGWFFNTESYFYNNTSTNTSGNCFGLGWTYPRFNYGGGYFTRDTYEGFPDQTKVKFEFQGGKAWLDGWLWGDRSAATLTSTTWLPLFADHRGSSVIEHADNYWRIHSFKAIDGGAVIADIIPVRKDGYGEMYDRVAKQFLERIGTLGVGPDARG